MHCLIGILLAFGLWLGQAAPSWAAPETDVLRFGITPVFLDDQIDFLNDWRTYLRKRLGRDVQFVQRGSYRDITDLLLRGNLDVAWICGFPYVQNLDELTLVAVPLNHGEPLYESYLIVSRDDRVVRTWEDLKGGVFTYSDPDSNSGYLYPQYAMQQLGIDPASHFRKTFFAWGHRNVIEAVAEGLADGGAVDGYVWDALDTIHPEITARTRIVARSPKFGFPPIVAPEGVSARLIGSLRRVFTGMSADRQGREILRRLKLNGFTAASPELFGSIRRMMKSVEAGS